MNYGGMFGSFANPHKEKTYSNECNALLENVIGHFKKEKDHSTVYLFDRGQASAEAFKNMKIEKGLWFIGRLNENRKLRHISSLTIDNVEFTQGELLEDGLSTIQKSTKNNKERERISLNGVDRRGFSYYSFHS